MSFLVKEDEALDPAPVRFFSSQAKMTKPGDVPKLIPKLFFSHVMHNSTFSCIMKPC
jgi:hypothetical protein